MYATLAGILAYLDIREIVRLTDGSGETPGEALDNVIFDVAGRIDEALRRRSHAAADYDAGYLTSLGSRLALGALWSRKPNAKVPELLKHVYKKAEEELDAIASGSAGSSTPSAHVISNPARGWPISEA